MVGVFYAIGNIKLSIENWAEALSNYTKSYEYAVLTTDVLLKIDCIYGISLALRRQNYYKEALVFLLKANRLSDSVSSDKFLANIYNQKGIIYCDWGRNADAK